MLLVSILGMAGCVRPDLLRAEPDLGHPTTMDSQRDIILAVDNPRASPPIHAGSSLLGYAGTRDYGAGQDASRMLGDLQRHYGWRQVAGWPISSLGLYCIVLEPPKGTTREAMLAMLARDRRVQLAQPLRDYALYGESNAQPRHYNDPYVDLQRGFVSTEAALAHDTTEGEGVHIAVIDTGADTDHPDLHGRIRDARDFVDADDRAFRADQHGTEVAGIIAATGNNDRGIVGMAPQAALSIYKACWYVGDDEGARCNSFTLAKALAAVAGSDARIINLSLGGPADPLLERLLEKLLEQGDIAIAALPPDGRLDGFPDNVPGVLVVRNTSTASASPGILGAPGKDILSTEPGGSYDFSSGSSMATAHVTGIVALLLAISPGLDARTVHRILLDSSRQTPGGPQVDAASAVAMLLHRGAAPPQSPCSGPTASARSGHCD